VQRILYIPFDQLHRNYGVLKDADKSNDVIAMIESQAMVTGANWHPERLFFLISSARHFAKDLRDEGFTVDYRKAANTPSGLQEIQKEHKGAPIICAEQSSFRLTEKLTTINAEFIPNDFFLTPRDLFASWAGSQKSYLMENFYRKQRVRLNILMEGDQPAGGAWNFDKDNRLPPPKNYTWPAYLEHARDEIDTEVATELKMTPTTTTGLLHQKSFRTLWSLRRCDGVRQLVTAPLAAKPILEQRTLTSCRSDQGRRESFQNRQSSHRIRRSICSPNHRLARIRQRYVLVLRS